MVEHVKTNWRQANLSSRQRAILGFTEKLTLRPWEMREQDVAELRRYGLSDAEVLAVVLLVGFFSLATRIADGLGVELDPEIRDL